MILDALLTDECSDIIAHNGNYSLLDFLEGLIYDNGDYTFEELDDLGFEKVVYMYLADMVNSANGIKYTNFNEVFQEIDEYVEYNSENGITEHSLLYELLANLEYYGFDVDLLTEDYVYFKFNFNN